MPDRLLITGAGGLVGRSLTALARERGHAVTPLTSADCDITNPDAVDQQVAAGDVVINCAAFTKVDDAERDEQRAFAVNATGPGNLARTCTRVGARLIHVSTDYVFDGTFADGVRRPYEIDDPTGPLSAYGRSKLAGEHEVHAAAPDARVVRTSWIFSGGWGGDFVAGIVEKAGGTDPFDVVADQIGSPTYVADLAEALLGLVTSDVSAPLLHVSNGGEASRHEQARAVFELLGADPERIRPVGSDAHPRPAPRPPYSALSGEKSARAGLTPLRPWRDALAAALDSPPDSVLPLPSTR